MPASAAAGSGVQARHERRPERSVGRGGGWAGRLLVQLRLGRASYGIRCLGIEVLQVIIEVRRTFFRMDTSFSSDGRSKSACVLSSVLIAYLVVQHHDGCGNRALLSAVKIFDRILRNRWVSRPLSIQFNRCTARTSAAL